MVFWRHFSVQTNNTLQFQNEIRGVWQEDPEYISTEVREKVTWKIPTNADKNVVERTASLEARQQVWAGVSKNYKDGKFASGNGDTANLIKKNDHLKSCLKHNAEITSKKYINLKNWAQ